MLIYCEKNLTKNFFFNITKLLLEKSSFISSYNFQMVKTPILSRYSVIITLVYLEIHMDNFTCNILVF